jgi:hypothetical protein
MARIALEAASGLDLPNEQSAERDPLELQQFRATFASRWQTLGCEMLPVSMLRYNCHGMTFAARRTWIDDRRLVPHIIAGDGYAEVDGNSAVPGDIVVYFDERGLAEHSGFVVEAATRQTIRIPKVISKWGKAYEVLHWANRCPYEIRFLRYYRLTAEKVKGT